MTPEPSRVQRLVAALAYEYQREQNDEYNSGPRRRRPELRPFVDLTPYADLSDEQVARELGIKGSDVAYVAGWIADERAGLLGGPEGRCEAGTKRWGWLRCHRPAMPDERWCGHHHPQPPTRALPPVRLAPWDLAARPDGAVLQALYDLTDQQHNLGRAIAAVLTRLDLAEKRREAEPGPEMLNVAQAAEMLGLSKRTIYAMRRSNRLPYVRMGGQYRFRPHDLEKWLVERTIHAVR